MLHKKVLIIDNYDSFTFNIKHYVEHLGAKTLVLQNDDEQLLDFAKLNPTHLILSPGPGTPENAGYTQQLILNHHLHYPLLGICLGHQAIAQAFGAQIISAPKIMHGRVSVIHHRGLGLFTHIHNPFNATRYHSLAVDRNLRSTARE
jgi:anthranilate synthase/aminodeoxychorismate synthase-like glutamine amidotransferase